MNKPCRSWGVGGVTGGREECSGRRLGTWGVCLWFLGSTLGCMFCFFSLRAEQQCFFLSGFSGMAGTLETRLLWFTCTLLGMEKETAEQYEQALPFYSEATMIGSMSSSRYSLQCEVL